MAKTRRTKPKSKAKNKSRRGSRRGYGWLRAVVWYLLGLFGFLLPSWYFYLDYVADSIVVANQATPSVIYARPLELFQGKNLSPKGLSFELDLLGYRQVAGTPKLGEYKRHQQGSAAVFEIFSKGFQFVDEQLSPQSIKLSIVNNQVSHIKPKLIRLEPKVIGHFFSANFESRKPLDLQQLPNRLVIGVQAVEDRHFKHHNGVDWWGVIRAAAKNLLAMKVVQGGSTITQQLVKNKLQYREKTWLRKIHEAIVASMLEGKISKKDILQMYLNEVYLGQNGKVAIHGMAEAAKFYFAKTVQQLSVAEQALLIGLIKGPSWYNPYRHHQRAKQRRNVVLDIWLETGVINKQQWQTAKSSSLNLSQHRQIKTDFEDYLAVVRRELLAEKNKLFSDRRLKQEGLQIFTNLDPFVQHLTNQTAARTDHWLSSKVESAIVVSDAKNGALLAVSGSKSGHSYFNRALLAKRQIGSLIKPLLFLAALERLPDFDLNQLLHDSPLSLRTENGKSWRPKNWDHKSFGEIRAFDALLWSRNQATVDLGLQLGLSRFVNFLQGLGLQINRSNHPSLFLGALELTPLEVQHLFSLFPSQGQIRQTRAIQYVTDASRKPLTDIKSPSYASLKRANINAINAALQQITMSGTAKKISNRFHLAQPLYGKTGTTNQGKDSWFVGFDPYYLITVWVGRDDNRATPYSGSSGALVLWSHLLLNLRQ